MKYEVKDLNAPSRWNMRIWDDDKKEWLCQSDKDALTYYGFDITGGETTEFQGLPKWHPDRHLIWEQSTGLLDRNGVETYEGDIVYDIYTGDEVFIVGWDKDKASFMLAGTAGYPLAYFDEYNLDKDLKVIGNLHENPELIGGGE
jgi:uncharacterized phage protein (TIGR01671 family)